MKKISFLLALSRGFSALGGQLTITILPVVIFIISHSIALAGLALGARLLISMVFNPISGVFIDRLNPKVMMIVSLVSRTILFAVMAEIHSTLALTVLVSLTAVGGMLESTAVGTLTPKLISAEDLPKANAAISSALNLAFIIGPLAGGALISRFPASWGFLAAAFSQVIAMVCTLWLPSPPFTRTALERHSHVGSELLSGVRFAFQDRFTRILLTIYSMYILGLTAMNVLAMGLSFEFHMGSEGYGMIIAIQAIGMLVVTFITSRWMSAGAVVPLFLGSMPTQGLAEMAVALSPTFLSSAGFIFVGGLGWGMEQASVMTILQQRIPGPLQGRVFGLFFSALSLAETVGVSVSGWLGERIGASHALLIAGSFSFLFSIIGLILLMPILRAEKNISMAGGDQDVPFM